MLRRLMGMSGRAKLLLIAVSVVAADAIYAAYLARQFRTFPTHRTTARIFDLETPGRIMVRRYILRPGTASYNTDARSLVYSPGVVADVWWNRRIVDSDFESMDDEDLNTFLPQYPLVPRDLALVLIERSASKRVFTGLRLCHKFDDHGLGQRCRQLAVQASQAAVDEDDVLALASLALRIRESLPVLLPKLETVLLASGDEYAAESLLIELAEECADPPETREPLSKWIIKITAALKRRLGDSEARLLGCLTPGPAAIVDAFKLLPDSVLDPLDEVGLLLFAHNTVETAVEVWNTVRKDLTSAQPGVVALHAVLHADVDHAVQLASDVLAGTDSSLRKGIVVLLARHDVEPGPSKLDEAFSGTAPRLTYFKSVSHYLGSKAAREYIRLAGHDYLETGKQWPPRGVGDAAGWRHFIQQYPWFPGTDDAYYQLAYALLTTHQCESVTALGEEFLARSAWADYDAAAYVFHAIRVALVNCDGGATLSPDLQVARQLLRRPLAIALVSPEHFSETKTAVLTLTNRPGAVKVLGMDETAVDELVSFVTSFDDDGDSEARLKNAIQMLNKLESRNRWALLFHASKDIEEQPDARVRWSQPHRELAEAVIRAMGQRATNVGSNPDATFAALFALTVLEDPSARRLRVFRELMEAVAKVQTTQLHSSWHPLLTDVHREVAGEARQ